MVAHYEEQLLQSQRDLQDAYALIKVEEMRRLQMEEEMRRMFQKSISNLNQEAQTIFQSVQRADVDTLLSTTAGAVPGSTPAYSAKGNSASADLFGEEEKKLSNNSSNNNNSSGQMYPTPRPEPGSILATPAATAINKESVLKNVRDEGYLDRLTEMYRQSMSSSTKFAGADPSLAGTPIPGKPKVIPLNQPQDLPRTGSSGSLPRTGSSGSMLPRTGSAKSLQRTDSGRWKI